MVSGVDLQFQWHHLLFRHHSHSIPLIGITLSLVYHTPKESLVTLHYRPDSQLVVCLQPDEAIHESAATHVYTSSTEGCGQVLPISISTYILRHVATKRDDPLATVNHEIHVCIYFVRICVRCCSAHDLNHMIFSAYIVFGRPLLQIRMN